MGRHEIPGFGVFLHSREEVTPLPRLQSWRDLPLNSMLDQFVLHPWQVA